MFLKQFPREATGCLSYVLGEIFDECVVIDPIEEYVDEYKSVVDNHGMTVKGILDTHVHADHISGAQALSAPTGAPIYMHKSAGARFKFSPLGEGDGLRVGDIDIKFLETPGHTPESLTLVVDKSMLITGDTLFVGSVGRPDLIVSEEEDVEERAGQLFESIFGKLLKFDDYVEVYPGHYAVSACGSGLSYKANSTIGYEKRFNQALKYSRKEDFVKFIVSTLPPSIPDYKKTKDLNLDRRVSLSSSIRPTLQLERSVECGSILPEELHRRLSEKREIQVVDVREPVELRKGFISVARNIPLMQLPRRLKELRKDTETVFVCASGRRSMKAGRFLMREGWSQVKNLAGGMNRWGEEGFPVTLPKD